MAELFRRVETFYRMGGRVRSTLTRFVSAKFVEIFLLSHVLAYRRTTHHTPMSVTCRS